MSLSLSLSLKGSFLNAGETKEFWRELLEEVAKCSAKACRLEAKSSATAGSLEAKSIATAVPQEAKSSAPADSVEAMSSAPFDDVEANSSASADTLEANSSAYGDSLEDICGPARLFSFLVTAFQKDLEIWWKHGRKKPTNDRCQLPILHYILGRL